MKNTLLTSAAVSALLSAFPAQAQECTAAPSCSTLGYTKTASQCAGKVYTRCPFDSTKYNCPADNKVSDRVCQEQGFIDKREYCAGNYVACPNNETMVRCLQTAVAGDIKFSKANGNHDGWLLCNGKTYKAAEYPELYALLGTETLPDYRDATRPDSTKVFIYAGRKMSGYDACEQKGLINVNNIRAGQSFTSVPAAGQNCVLPGAFTLWDACVNHFTDPGQGYVGQYCYNDIIDECGIGDPTMYDEAFSSFEACSVFLGSLVKQCSLDPSCMEGIFNIYSE